MEKKERKEKRKDRFVVDLYIRVSTDRQAKEGDSLDEQEAELKKFCEFRGFQIHRILIERGLSAGSTNRPEYQKLISDIQSDKIDAIVVKKLDRLSRSLMDFEQLMSLLKAHNVGFISLRENFDTTTAMGKAMLRIALVFAQLEREQTSERLIDVLDYRASKGMYNGGICPFGYSNVDKELVPYPKERQLVELMFKLFVDTHSTTQIAKELNISGHRNRKGELWDKRMIQHILQNPIYIGKVRWKLKLYQGLHQPIISENQFQKVDHIFKNRLLSTRKKTNALLQKSLFCSHCQSPMTPSHSLNRTKTKYYYYRCTNSQNSKKGVCPLKQINFKVVEHQVISILLALSESTHFLPVENKIYKHNDDIKLNCESIAQTMKDLDTQIQTIKSKKDQFLDSLISSQFASSERDKINKRIDELEQEEKQLKSQRYQAEFELINTQDHLINLAQIKTLPTSYKSD